MDRAHTLLALALSLAASGCAEGTWPSFEEAPPNEEGSRTGARAGDVRIRLMAANLTSGNVQSYQEAGMRLLQGLAPDVVLIQELNVGTGSPAELRAFVDQTFGPEFVYYREGGAQIPNGIISRYPIVEAGEWDDPHVGNRDFAWARIDIPGPVDLYAVSVHLLGTSASDRAAEAQSLRARLRELPDDSFVVVGGDFNTKNRGEECVTTLAQVVVTSGPYPADGLGNTFTNSTRSRPYDWLVADSSLHARAIPVVVGASEFSHGLVVDSRVYQPLSDIAPVRLADSGAANMQHMAVVRDFAVAGDPASSIEVTSPNGGEVWTAGETRDLTFSAAGIDEVTVEVSLDGTSWIPVAEGVPAADGKVAFTVPATATDDGRVRVSAGEIVDVSDGPFRIEVPVAPGRLFLNEILANEPGSDPAGEYVEIVNGGGQAVDLGGLTLSDSRAVRHVFAEGTLLGPGQAILVYGAAQAIPSDAARAVASSTGQLALNNTGDTVTLADAAGEVVDSVTYGPELAARDGVSMNRSPDGDPDGGFVLHDGVGLGPASPGRRADGGAFD